MGIQSFFVKKLLKSKLKGMPEAQQEQVMAMVEKNPEFFKKIGEEIEKRKKSGEDETAAAMHVMRQHQAEFRNLLM